jgi:exopolysaccharide production protein ExoQ
MSRWYYYASAFFILHCMAAFGIIDRLLYGEWLGKSGDKLSQSFNLLLIITSVALFSRGFRRIRGVRTGAILGIALIGFLLSSAAWSIAPAMTIREAIIYLFVIVGSIGIATNLSCDEYMRLLCQMCFWAGVASLVLLVVDRAAAFGDSGDFRGIFGQKNPLGEAMTMGALASLHILRASRRGRLFSIISLALVTTVAVMSQSATSCLTIFAFCGVAAMASLIRKGGVIRMLAIMAAVLLLPVVVLVAAFPDALFETIGKDPTLTGRTEIWTFVITQISQRPWFGWGFKAFWSTENPVAMELASQLRWFVPQSHNGLLEILLFIGFIGMLFFVYLWARTVWLSFSCMGSSSASVGLSSLSSCIGIILLGVSETVLMEPFEASTSVFFITGLMCERAVRATSRKRYRATRKGAVPERRGVSVGRPITAFGPTTR